MGRKNRKKNRGVATSSTSSSTPAEAVEENSNSSEETTTAKSTDTTTEATPDTSKSVNKEVVEETTPEEVVESPSKINEIIPVNKPVIPRIHGPNKVWFRSNGTSLYFGAGEELEITSDQAQLFIDKGHGEVFEKE